jgi:hypothetical protein
VLLALGGLGVAQREKAAFCYFAGHCRLGFVTVDLVKVMGVP